MASKENGRRAPDGAERSGAPSGAAPRPDPEVLEKAKRRQFSSAYKLRIVEEADRCREPGGIAALLRREGLYSSHLTEWRRARREGALGALSKRRGPKGQRRDAVTRENEELRKENARLKRRLKQAETILEIQKNHPRAASHSHLSDQKLRLPSTRLGPGGAAANFLETEIPEKNMVEGLQRTCEW